MGGVEYAAPIVMILLLYFLVPAFLNNRQHRLIERMESIYAESLIRIARVHIAGGKIRIPAVLVITTDLIVIRNALSLYPDEIPFERLRGLSLGEDLLPASDQSTGTDRTSGMLIITTVHQTFNLQFTGPDEALACKQEIERTL